MKKRGIFLLAFIAVILYILANYTSGNAQAPQTIHVREVSEQFPGVQVPGRIVGFSCAGVDRSVHCYVASAE